MDPKIEALDVELEAIRSELLSIEAIDEPTEENVARSAELLAAWDEKDAARTKAVARAEKIERVRSAALNPANVERAVEAPNVSIKRDPFADMDSVRAGIVPPSEMRARVLTAIEDSPADGVSDAARQQATVLTQRSDARLHQYALATANPAYRSAFEKVLQYPDSYHSQLTPEEAYALRTAMSTTSANGGYAIPFLLDPTVILTSTGSQNPFRQISRIESGMSNKWQGLTSAGVTAQWLAEATAVTDASPTFGQPSITAHKGAAYIIGSYEVIEDTNLAAELPRMVQDGKDRLEAAAFAVGSGSGAPYGVVTSVTAVTASRVSPTTAGTFTTASRADVDATIEALPDVHQDKASWVSHYKNYGIIRRMDTYGGGNFWANMGGGQPTELLGLPTYKSVHMDSTITTGSEVLIVGDFQNYLIYDRIGVQLEYVQNVVDGSGVPTLQRGWVAHWRTGADVLNVDAFRTLRL